MGRQVHKGDRKPKGFWDSPEVNEVFAEFLDKKLDIDAAYRRLNIVSYGEPMASATFQWYLRRYLRRTPQRDANSTGPTTERHTGVEYVTVGEGGRLVIPARYRQALGLRDGDQVIMWRTNDELRMLTPLHALKRAQMIVRHRVGKDRSLADELITERRREGRSE